MKNRIDGKDKNLYCMSFKWLQMPQIRKELMIFEPEAGMEAMTRPFYISENRYEKQSWNILKNYDTYGYPAVEQLEALAKQGQKVYGCGVKFQYGCTEKAHKDGGTYLAPLEYWKHVHTEVYRSKGGSVEVRVGEVSIMAIPYEVPILGDDGAVLYSVRLWDAKPKYEYRMEDLKKEHWVKAMEHMQIPEQIAAELLFPQMYMGGKQNCLIQKYFMVSATVQWAVKKHVEQFHDIRNFHEKNVFHLCDERCALVVPELMRILQGKYHLDWDEAWNIVDQVCVYEMDEPVTNIFELWTEEIVRRTLPEIYQIAVEMFWW